MDRRKFIILGIGAATATAAAAATIRGGKKENSPEGPNVVAVVRSAESVNPEGMTRGVYTRLLSEALTAATGEPDTGGAVKRIASASETVGFKLNLLAGPALSPSANMSAAMAGLFISSGFDPSRLIFWERMSSELRRCGYSGRTVGAAVTATDDPGNGYEDEPETSGEIGSCFSRILTRRISALVSVGVVKDHDLAGVSCAVKNLYGCIHNPNKYHDNNCNPYLPDLLAAASIRSRMRFAVLDAAKVQYDGGPLHNPARCLFFGGVIAGRDPIAVDSVARSIIEKARKENRLPGLKEAGRDPSWLETAEKRGLGTASLERIKVVEKVI